MRRSWLSGAVLMVVGLGTGAFAAGERVATRLENGLLFRLVEKHSILRMNEPAFVPKALADSYMGEFEPVIGIADGPIAKAYPAWLLEGYSVINDRAGKQPIVVSWSPFSFTARAFSRVLDGDTLSFEDSGELWKDAMVLVDMKTGSRWSQVEGRALDGPMKGKQLRVVPSIYTKWGKWHSLYPHTSCLTKLGRELTKSDFAGYYDRTQQLGPANTANPDSRLAGKELVIGFIYNGTPVAVPLYALVEHKQFGLVVNGTPLEVQFDRLSETAVVFSRVLDRDTLELIRLDFTKGESYLRSSEDATTWLTYSGKGISGPRAARALEQIPSTLCFWFVWVQHYPQTQLWETPGATPAQ